MRTPRKNSYQAAMANLREAYEAYDREKKEHLNRWEKTYGSLLFDRIRECQREAGRLRGLAIKRDVKKTNKPEVPV